MTQYLDNKSFLRALCEHRALICANESPRVSEFIGNCLYMLCTRMGSRSNFNGYTFNDELIGDAIQNCLEAVNNFDPSKSSNPFGYFSRIAWRAMLHRIDIEQKQVAAKIYNYENLHSIQANHENIVARIGNQFTDEFIRQFEKKQATRRAKRRPKRAPLRKKKIK